MLVEDAPVASTSGTQAGPAVAGAKRKAEDDGDVIDLTLADSSLSKKTHSDFFVLGWNSVLFLERNRDVLSVAKSHTIVEICEGSYGSMTSTLSRTVNSGTPSLFESFREPRTLPG